MRKVTAKKKAKGSSITTASAARPQRPVVKAASKVGASAKITARAPLARATVVRTNGAANGVRSIGAANGAASGVVNGGAVKGIVSVKNVPNKNIPAKGVAVKSMPLKGVAVKGAPIKQIPAALPPAVKLVPFKEEYKLGDKVVYPAHGVGIIDALQVRSISGSEHKFYMITIVETGMKIMVPVTQADTVGLRRVVDSKTIEKVYDILRDRKVTIDTQTWNRRYREYTQKIKTGSVFEIARVIRDLSVLKSDKELSFGERKMLDTAQGLLVKEISIAKSRPEDAVKAELEELFHIVL